MSFPAPSSLVCNPSPRRWTLAVAVSALLFSPGYQAHAQSLNIWQGDASSDITDPDNWSQGLDNGLGNILINAGSPNPPVWSIGAPSVSPSLNTWYLELERASVGSGPGATGYWSVNTLLSDPSGGYASLFVQGADAAMLLVGVDGGTGRVDFALAPVTDAPGTQLHVDHYAAESIGLGVGTGSGSSGTVNVMGRGKSVYSQSTSGQFAAGSLEFLHASHEIGADGGTGIVNVQDGAWITQRGPADPSTGLSTAPMLSLGVAGTGTVNVLGGGKIAFGVQTYGPEPAVRIGAEGGTGTLVLSGANAGGYASNAHFNGGVDLGSGAGSVGTVNVLAGGKLLNMTNQNSLQDPVTGDLIAPPPVQVGLDGGTANVTVSDAVWYVGGAYGPSYISLDHNDDEYDDNYEYLSEITDGTQIGHLHVGVSGAGVVNIADGGVVSLGTAYAGTINESWPDYSRYYYGLIRFDGGQGTLYLGETASGNGTMAIGGAPGAAALAPGILQAAQVLFGPGAGTVAFNHTALDYVFNIPLVGVGAIANYAGTTWLQPAASPPAGAPADNSAFSGYTRLYGGELGLGYNAAIGSSQGQVVADAGLVYAGGVDIANGFELEGAAALSVRVDQAGTATQSGVFTGTGNLDKIEGGTLLLAGSNTHSGETRVKGGVLALTGTGSVASSSRVVADALFDVSAATAPVFIRSLAGSGVVQLGANPLTLTAAGDTFAGQLAGSGLFSVAAGVETLSGDSSAFAGSSTVAGQLWVEGVLGTATTNATVQDGGQLGGNGRIGGSVAVGDGGTLVPGPALDVPGQLTIDGGLALAPAATMRFLFGQAGVAGGAFNDVVTVGGDLTLDGTLDVSTPAGGTFLPGTYRVIDYAGTLTDRGLALGALPPIDASVVVQTALAKQVNLVLTPPNIALTFWDGDAGPKANDRIDGGDGAWQSSAGNENWTDYAGAINAPFADGSFAIFDGAAGNVRVDSSLGQVSVSGMQFASGGYRIGGDPILLVESDALIRVGASSVGRTNLLAAGAEQVARIDATLTGDARLVKSDGGTLVLGGQNGYTGGTLVQGGILEVSADAALGAAGGALDFEFGGLRTTASLSSTRAVDINTLGAFLPQSGTTLSLSGAISGSGTLIKGGAGALQLTGISSLSGPTRIANGLLVVDGGIAGSAVNVDAGATLAGTGTVGSTTLHPGAVIAPGHSIGTLSVSGNYLQQGRSRYQVEVDPNSSSDRIQVSGTATLEDDAQLSVSRTAEAPYRLGTRYTVLSADGGVSGTYVLGGDVGLSPFLSLTDTYDPTNAYLEVVRTDVPIEPMCPPNAGAAAGAIKSQAPGSSLQTALLNQASVDDACELAGEVAGEILASMRSAFLEDSRFLREAVGTRAGAPQSTSTTGNGVWAHVFGSRGSFDPGRYPATLDRNIGGVFVGADAEVGSTGRVGFVGGFSDASLDVDRWHSSLSSDSYHLGVYAAAASNDWNFHAGAAYSWHDVEASQWVDAKYFSDHMEADFDASTRQVFGEVSRPLVSEGVKLQPFLAAAYVELRGDGFQERGGEATRNVESAKDDVFFTTLGMRLENSYTSAGGTRMRLRAMAGWRHAEGDISPRLRLAFADGSPFEIEGVPITREALGLELGIEAAVSERVKLGALYSGQLGSGLDDHGGKAYVEWKF